MPRDNSTTISPNSTQGFADCKVWYDHFHKSALFIAPDKIVIAFRGTHHHEVQWLR